MGNYRFRLSDMIPNAWFYMFSRHNKNHNNKKVHTPSSSESASASLAEPPNNHLSKITKLPNLSDQRKSYYFTRDLTSHSNSPPRRSLSRRRRSTKRSRLHNSQPEPQPVSAAISAGCNCRATLESVWTKPPPEYCNDDSQTDQTISSSDYHGSTLTECGTDRGLIPDDALDDDSSSNSCKCRIGNDVVSTNMDDNNRVSDFHHHLPPIITKKQHHDPTKTHHRTSSAEFSEKNESQVKVGKENFSSPVRRFSGNSSLSPGVKLRTNTPKIANRRIQGRKSVSASGGSRRNVSASFAVVKSSKDPGRDFRESMVEMIVENNIRGSKDLEELLACYLSLNSNEYHELIINVFRQIWFDFIRFRLK